MNHTAMIAAVTRRWSDGPICVFKIGNEYGIARPSTPEYAELENIKGTELIGCYQKPHSHARAETFVNRDI